MATTGASLGPIYERLNGVAQQHPMNAETFADWATEAGDTVTVNRDGKSYGSRVDEAVITWRGKTPMVTINSGGNEKRDAVSKVSKQKYSRGGSGMSIQQGLYSDVWSEDGHVHSVISQTASTLSLFVEEKYSQMTAGLKLTSSSAALYVDNKYAQMTAGLMLTSSSAALYVDNKYSQMTAGLNLTSSSAALYVDNKYSQMTAGLKLTSSSAALYVENKYTQMTAGLKLSSSSAALYVDSKYDQMTAGLKLSSSSAALYVENKYTQMTAGLKLSSSSAALYVENKYTQMTAGLKLSSSSAALYVDSKYDQMTAGLKLSSSSAALYVENKYTQMTAGLKLSSSSAALYVENKYTQMTAGLKLSSSSAALYVENKYTQMTSGLKLSSSSAALYVDSKYDQMTSGLKLTSSSAALYVENKYTQMVSGLQLTSSSAVMYAQSRTTRAYIMTRINADGEGEAIIDADKVSIDGTTTINDVLTITDNRLYMKKDVRINGDAMAETLTLRSGSDHATISEYDLEHVIKSATVSGNVLTLTPVKGNAITFSKATSLSDGWSGNTYTVTAKQNETEVGRKSTTPFVQIETGGYVYNNFDVAVATAGASGQGYNIHGDKTYIYLVQNGDSVRANTKNDGTGTNLAGLTVTDPYLLPGNIRNGVTILGVRGDYSGTSYASRTLQCTSVEHTYPGSSTYYYTFRLEGSYSFNSGSSYTFYRPSWS